MLDVICRDYEQSSLAKTVVSHSVTHIERRLHRSPVGDYEQSGDDVLKYGMTGKGRICMFSIGMIRTIQLLPLVVKIDQNFSLIRFAP